MLCGVYFLPRTIDKLRAELPGGVMGPYLNHDTGFSAWVVRKLGLDMNEFRDAVARAATEDDVVAWLAQRIPAGAGESINAKFETFLASRMSPADQQLVRERHPVMAERPDLDRILDILEAEDARAFASR
ncbi:hypothetical protein WPS_05870 [Vulcanimicrobium alpinum]|uniref:DUF5069 domain-containing protein n=1 Tax=Vulcanimicrobium alpinum TaxID=3016050 RepID=A0AAN1XTC7_UNVUL|nr:hypothetical protein WPS_05870 [Vulcanimicrobium alpinum]